VSRARLVILPPPSVNPESLLSMGPQSLAEGDGGSSNMTFQLVRGADGYGPISYSYETLPGTATAGVDYTHVSGSGTINAGQTINISVPVLGDTSDESDETFSLRVFNIAFS
jgi:hypothetical protein